MYAPTDMTLFRKEVSDRILTNIKTNRLKAKERLEQVLYVTCQVESQERYAGTQEAYVPFIYPVAMLLRQLYDNADVWADAQDAIMSKVHNTAPLTAFHNTITDKLRASMPPVCRECSELALYIMRDYLEQHYDALKTLLTPEFIRVDADTILTSGRQFCQTLAVAGVGIVILDSKNEDMTESLLYHWAAPCGVHMGESQEADSLPSWLSDTFLSVANQRNITGMMGLLLLHAIDDTITSTMIFDAALAAVDYDVGWSGRMRDESVRNRFIWPKPIYEDALLATQLRISDLETPDWTVQSETESTLPNRKFTTYLSVRQVIEIALQRPILCDIADVEWNREFFRQFNLSDHEAETCAYLTAALRANYDAQDEIQELRDRLDSIYIQSQEMEQKNQKLQVSVQRLQKENEDVKAQLRQAERECRTSQHALREQEKVLKGNKAMHALQEENNQLQIALEELTTVLAQEDEPLPENISFPYYTDKKIVLVGGFDVFHQAIKKLIPGIRTIAFGNGRFNPAPLHTADVICFQTNRCNHSQYWYCIAQAKNAGKQFIHLRNANAELCAKTIIQQIEHRQAEGTTV